MVLCRWESIAGNLVLTTELKRIYWPLSRVKKQTFWVIEGIVGCVRAYMQKVELPFWWEYGDEKTGINWWNEKYLLISWGLRVPIWKINFCSSVLRLSKLPRCKERLQTAICCFEWLGRLKYLATGLDVSLSFLSILRRCSWNGSPSHLPVSPMYNLLQ